MQCDLLDRLSMILKSYEIKFKLTIRLRKSADSQGTGTRVQVIFAVSESYPAKKSLSSRLFAQRAWERRRMLNHVRVLPYLSLTKTAFRRSEIFEIWKRRWQIWHILYIYHNVFLFKISKLYCKVDFTSRMTTSYLSVFNRNI